MARRAAALFALLLALALIAPAAAGAAKDEKPAPGDVSPAAATKAAAADPNVAKEEERNGRGRFPRSLLTGQRVRHPALSLRHRHGYPAAFSP